MYIGMRSWHLGRKSYFAQRAGVRWLLRKRKKLTVSRPHPLWSEQDPEQWWQATDRAMKALGDQHSLQDVKALGIAGQMHGATLLDAQQRVLRPAIFVERRALCARVHFAGSESSAITSDYRQPDDARIYCA